MQSESIEMRRADMARISPGARRIFCAISLVVSSLSLLPARVDAQIQFEDVTNAAGISGNATESYGASWGDYNGDGYPEIFIDNHRDFGRLWENNADGTFTDVSSQADVSDAFGPDAVFRKDTHGSAWGDLDNDGDQDLITTESTKDGHYLISDGAGSLTDMGPALGFNLIHDNGSRLPIIFDANNDGLVDVKVIGRRETASNFFRQNANGTFSRIGNSLGITCPVGAQWGQLIDVNASGTLELMCANGAGFPARVVDYASGSGVSLPSTFVNRTRDAVSGDFNNDQRQDIVHVLGAFRPNEAIQVNATTVEALIVITSNNTSKTITIETAGAISVDLGRRTRVGCPARRR